MRLNSLSSVMGAKLAGAQTPEQTIPAQLEKCGVKPEETLRTVHESHLVRRGLVEIERRRRFAIPDLETGDHAQGSGPP